MEINLPAFLQIKYPQAYVVGGAVRDLLRGLTPTDYDIVVGSDPECFAQNLAQILNGRLVILGKDNFCLYRVASSRGLIDITTFKGPDIQSDLRARDFTINALACPLGSTQILDYTGGLSDLNQNTLRMVSPDSFIQDPVRLIRAHRLAANLNLHIEPATHAAIAIQAPLIKHVAAERVWVELKLIFDNFVSHETLMQMIQNGLLFAIVPEMAPLSHCRQNQHHVGDVLTHTMAAYKYLEDLLNLKRQDLPVSVQSIITQVQDAHKSFLKFSILLHDIGKPVSAGSRPSGLAIHFYGHAEKGASIAQEICRRLRVPNRHRDLVSFIVRHHQRPLQLYLSGTDSPKAFGHFFRTCGDKTPYILLHALADNRAKRSIQKNRPSELLPFLYDLCDRYVQSVVPLKHHPTLISGHDLLETYHLSPSPLIGKLLTGLEEARLSGIIHNRDQAFEWVSRQLAQLGKQR